MSISKLSRIPPVRPSINVMQQAQSTGFLRRARVIGKWLCAYWGFVFLFLFVVAWVYIGQTDKLNKRAKYTIGHTTGDWNIGRSGVHYVYKYKVNASSYESADLGTGNGVKKATRFVVKYDSIEPDISLGYFELLVPDSIRQAPPNGWRTPPFPIPQWILDRNR